MHPKHRCFAKACRPECHAIRSSGTQMELVHPRRCNNESGPSALPFPGRIGNSAGHSLRETTLTGCPGGCVSNTGSCAQPTQGPSRGLPCLTAPPAITAWIRRTRKPHQSAVATPGSLESCARRRVCTWRRGLSCGTSRPEAGMHRSRTASSHPRMPQAAARPV